MYFVVVLGQSLPDAKDDNGRCVLLPTNPRVVRRACEWPSPRIGYRLDESDRSGA